MKNIIFSFFLLVSVFLVHAQEKNSEVNSEKIFVAVQEKAAPYEGIPEFAKTFSNNFDTSSVKTKSGTVNIRIQFVIEKDGSFTDVKILNDEHNLLSEVRRVFALMPKWKPAFSEGKPVRSKFTLPIVLNVDVEELKEISFNDAYLQALKNYDIDNEWYSFSCDCSLFNNVSKNQLLERVFEYKSLDEAVFYRIEIIEKKKYVGTDLMTNFEKSFKEDNGTISETKFRGEKSKLLVKENMYDGIKIYQKGVINESDEYITLAILSTPYEKGIDLVFTNFIDSFNIKK